MPSFVLEELSSSTSAQCQLALQDIHDRPYTQASRLFSLSNISLCVLPSLKLSKGKNLIKVHSCSTPSNGYVLDDLTLRGRLVGPELIPLNFDSDLRAKAYVSLPGIYHLNVQIFYLGEKRWELEFPLENKTSTISPMPYQYFGNTSEPNITRTDNCIFGCDQDIKVDFEIDSNRNFTFCESLDEMQNGRWRFFGIKGNETCLNKLNSCFGDLSVVNDADRMNYGWYWVPF